MRHRHLWSLLWIAVGCAHQAIDPQHVRSGSRLRISYSQPDTVLVRPPSATTQRLDVLMVEGTVLEVSADTLWLLSSEVTRPSRLIYRLEKDSRIGAPIVSSAILSIDRSSQARIERRVALGILLGALAAVAYVGLLYLYRER